MRDIEIRQFVADIITDVLTASCVKVFREPGREVSHYASDAITKGSFKVITFIQHPQVSLSNEEKEMMQRHAQTD